MSQVFFLCWILASISAAVYVSMLVGARIAARRKLQHQTSLAIAILIFTPLLGLIALVSLWVW